MNSASRSFVRRIATAVAAVLILFATPAWGHYLWVSAVPAGDQTTVNVYFEDAAAPGSGEYLVPIAKSGKTWTRTLDAPKPALIQMKETTQAKNRWLTGQIPKSPCFSVDSYAKFGVYRYGKTDVLLHYYARFLQVNSHDDLHELNRAGQLDLDIVPHDHEDKMDLTILWKGKPAVDRIVHVRGPKQFAENPKTDEKGKVRFTIKEPGVYVFRTNVEEATAGKDNDKDYALIRHHATMIMKLPLKE